MSDFKGYAPPGLIKRRCDSCGIEAFVEDLHEGLCPLCEEDDKIRVDAAYREHFGGAWTDPQSTWV